MRSTLQLRYPLRPSPLSPAYTLSRMSLDGGGGDGAVARVALRRRDGCGGGSGGGGVETAAPI